MTEIDYATSRTYYESLPKKRMATGALFFNEEGHLLIVKPTYREYWLIPGGAIEEDESPRAGCIREVKEEIDLDIALERLLCVDYIARENEKNESVHFEFYGGVLTLEHIQAIRLPAEELSAYQFSPIEEALSLLSPRLARRIPACLQALKAQTTAYLENGC